ncbi:E3 ubiquitin-protein ligase TRIM11-like [Podarcis muralis]
MAAAAESPVKDLCDEATCSICLEYFKDPVTIAECGHNFCRSCLIQCWGGGATRASCPHCRQTVRPKNLIPNRQLANFVEITKKLSLRGEKERVCEKHKELLKLFCKDHETPICVVCDRSREHERHKVIPLEEASEEYKGLIRSHLKNLRKEREAILAYQADVEEKSQDLLKLTEKERLKTVEKFRQLHQFLEEQEKQLLNQIEEAEKDIARKRDEHLARLSGKLSSLENIIKEMKEKSEKPAIQLLQDVRRTLQRYEQRERLENSAAFPQELKRRILEFCDINPLLEGVVKQFKDAQLLRQQLWKANITMGQKAAAHPSEDRKHVKCGHKSQDLLNNPERLNLLHSALKSNVTLDPDTANRILALSEDRKSVRLGAPRQDLPDNPERFDTVISVLGREGFAAGRHFWEVIVEREGEWAVGVTRKSLRRKGSFHLSSEEGIWAVGRWGGEYKAFDPPDVPFLFLRRELKRIQVFLNYEAGEVTFLNANSGAPLYTFSGASFSGETLLPFFYLWGEKTHLKIA